MMDYFERLGFPRRFSIDGGEVERRYLIQSREFHPDFHSLASEEEQKTAIEQTALLNQAYTTLKDPFRRAEYLHALLGGPSASQEKNLDQAFLMEMMEIRERLDDDRAACRDCRELEDDLERQYSGVLEKIGTMLDQPEQDPKQLVEIRKQLNAAKTIQSVLREVRGSPDRS